MSRKQALQVLSNAKKEAGDSAAKLSETATKQADSIRRQIIGSAELDSRNLQLRAVEASVNEVFGEALKRLSKVAPSARAKSLEGLIQEGVSVIGNRAKVSCSEKDKKGVYRLVRKLSKGSVKLTPDGNSIQTLGGVVLTSSDGTVKFDNTFEARLERLRPTLRKQVADILTATEK